MRALPTLKLVPRKTLHVTWADLLKGAWNSLGPGDVEAACGVVEQAWTGDGRTLACLSVRSAFDLTLTALGLEPGDEVLLSAVTIPHMAQLVRAHGAVPIPIDLDPATMAPRPELMARAISRRTRAVVVAHLFGGRVPLDELVAVAQAHELPIIEDCAQGYDGGDWRGDERAAVSLFSFGPIKTATALGGGLAVVRTPSLRAAMLSRRDQLPSVPRRTYLGKVAKYGAMKGLTHPLLFGAVVGAARAGGAEVDALLNGVTRSYRGTDLCAAVRQRPSAALLALLRDRISGDVAGWCSARKQLGDALSDRLPRDLQHLGRGASHHSHWLFPVVTGDPQALMRRLALAGFDATQGGDTLAVVAPPPGRPELAAATMARLMPQVVYLPLNPALRPDELDRLVAALAHDRAPGPVG